ncbi:MAG: PIN domain nuclease [Candidatus Omnitrophica bacterium CG11_big_fil_rev_8_21_14_0_20_45_26]|uniref:PIN domain nuclease n=1 Tax=Candidatus Abzuiibacterium crystallinum TaxID=1974748 RepID=A0A2H0LL28_9BACT|nr:MAG: PIN domain nuclease [Candidatus Omnitrophica bacterium CG11_big_fil_rev_8_21_14_0_20_45_26]PIW63776.1 MAG: PIN domain nuclease [Candidatus Omnitrophica bacterium CG12_big_fil_rev_8_21_14_0_65_45_16]
MIIALRFFILLISGGLGFYWGDQMPWHMTYSPWMGIALGLAAGVLIILIDLFFKSVSVKNILSLLLGVALGLLIHRLLIQLLIYARVDQAFLDQFALLSAVIFAYLGGITILRGQDEFSLILPFIKLESKGSHEEIILLDTSVIIDGRIADICETGFLGGKLFLPRFVLKELQLIADSSDPLKRNRGRRGLDILNRMKGNPSIQIRINETDAPDIPTVDAKLVRVAQMLNAKVFTNDYNLNKVAELQGVRVLNINELANALKPIVMPGETMQVKVLKEGKEQEQGVAYLDDGTMVVVDGGRKWINHNITVVITSVLQTQAGRMIFAKPQDGNGNKRN